MLTFLENTFVEVVCNFCILYQQHLSLGITLSSNNYCSAMILGNYCKKHTGVKENGM